MTFDEYTTIAHDDLFFDVNHITEYSIMVGVKIQKWSRFLYEEEKEKDNLENILSEKYKERFHYYSFDYEFTLEKKNIETYVKGDSEYLKIKKQFQEQTSLCKFIQSVVNALEKSSFTINNIIKFLEYQAGK